MIIRKSCFYHCLKTALWHDITIKNKTIKQHSNIQHQIIRLLTPFYNDKITFFENTTNTKQKEIKYIETYSCTTQKCVVTYAKLHGLFVVLSKTWLKHIIKIIEKYSMIKNMKIHQNNFNNTTKQWKHYKNIIKTLLCFIYFDNISMWCFDYIFIVWSSKYNTNITKM